jgi:hypothetical protein
MVSLGCLLAQSQRPELAIQVIEGDGAINSIRLHRAHEPIIKVVGATGEPVAGASVTFVLPSSGPSGTFGESGLSLTVQTDARGMAAGRGLRPNAIAGEFRIRATTAWRGAPATATLVQTNAEPVVKSGHGKTIVILALVAGAVAGGAAAATHGKSGGADQQTSAPPPAGGSISAGTPSFGPPH